MKFKFNLSCILFIIGQGFVVAASILQGDYLDHCQNVEPVRAVSIMFTKEVVYLLIVSS